MPARRLTTLLPAVTLAEAVETTHIHRVAGRTGARTAWVTTRPYRAPPHTIAAVGLIGGGQIPLPGGMPPGSAGRAFVGLVQTPSGLRTFRLSVGIHAGLCKSVHRGFPLPLEPLAPHQTCQLAQGCARLGSAAPGASLTGGALGCAKEGRRGDRAPMVRLLLARQATRAERAPSGAESDAQP
jgi:Magnesium chelatase, subunit ChlI